MACTVPRERKKVKRPAQKSHTPTHKNHKSQCVSIIRHFDHITHIYYHDLDETVLHRTCNLVENYAILHKSLTESRRVMYDDYDLDYTFANDYGLDEDGHYASDLDEDYARDGQDYQDLAYRHYA